MLETVLRRLSRFNPSERIAALHRKLNRLEADLHSLEQELRSSGLLTTEADFPFQEMQAGLDGVRAGLETAAAHADSFPESFWRPSTARWIAWPAAPRR
jgi:hypothetical protein